MNLLEDYFDSLTIAWKYKLLLAYSLFLPGGFGLAWAVFALKFSDVPFDIKMLSIFWQSGFLFFVPIYSITIGLLIFIFSLVVRHESYGIMYGQTYPKFSTKYWEYLKDALFFSFYVTLLFSLTILPMKLFGYEQGAISYLLYAVFAFIYWMFGFEFLKRNFRIFHHTNTPPFDIIEVCKNIRNDIKRDYKFVLISNLAYIFSFIPLFVLYNFYYLLDKPFAYIIVLTTILYISFINAMWNIAIYRYMSGRK